LKLIFPMKPLKKSPQFNPQSISLQKQKPEFQVNTSEDDLRTAVQAVTVIRSLCHSERTWETA
jgi:hypothetical protein